MNESTSSTAPATSTAAPTTAPTAALLLIGNELLSGRTRDANLQAIATRLAERGIRLRQTRVIPDETDAIVAAVNELRAGHDLLFTTGGIGPTHDDITTDAVAAAFGVEVVLHDEARRRLEAYAGQRGHVLNEDSLRMARIPVGATLIDNPVSAAPGFRLGNVLVMAGVPAIVRGMLDAVYEHLPSGLRVGSVSVSVFDRGESAIATPLRALQARYPEVDIGSYPGRVDGRSRVELVARSDDAERLAAVQRELQALVDGLPAVRR